MIYVSIISAIILIVLLMFLKYKEVSFSKIVCVALVLGFVFGLIFKDNASILKPVGSVYISLIKMVAIPLVFVSIINSFMKLDGVKQLKTIGIKTIGFYLGTTAIAVVVGMIVAKVMYVGQGFITTPVTDFKLKEIPSLSDIVMNIIPNNPIAALANGNMMSIIFFAIMVSVAAIIEESRRENSTKSFSEFMQSFGRIMIRMTELVLSLTPYGVFALIAGLSSQNGLDTLLPLISFIIAVYIGCILQIGIVHSILIKVIAKINPFRFFKSVYPAQVVSFTTCSSLGTLPVTIKCLTNRTKVSEKITSFVAPLGTSMGMNGCGGVYQGILCIFAANAFGVNLGISQYISIILSATIASIGLAGVPGSVFIASTTVLSSAGLPVEALGMVLGVDIVIDMIRTMTNVTGSSVIALIVGSLEKEFDRDRFNSEPFEDIK